MTPSKPVLPKFKPSQVRMFDRGLLPFPSTFGRSEIEIAAGVLVASSVFHGDAWQPLSLDQVREWLESVKKGPAGPWDGLVNNPFARPSLNELIAYGWARQHPLTGEDGDAPGGKIELETAFFRRLVEKGWVRI